MAAPVATAVPFSTALRESTREVHDRAQHSRYMKALFGGALSLDGYAQLAAQYFFIYQALEQLSDAMADDPVGAPFVVDELRRLPALEADLAFLFGADWREQLRPVPATLSYVRRLREQATWPGGYVAHHYTRYLGDIAGGQAVGALLKRSYGVTGPGALFYDFTALGSPVVFRDRYRARLNEAPWDEAERASIIEEAMTAFELNIDVFTELDSVVDHS